MANKDSQLFLGAKRLDNGTITMFLVEKNINGDQNIGHVTACTLHNYKKWSHFHRRNVVLNQLVHYCEIPLWINPQPGSTLGFWLSHNLAKDSTMFNNLDAKLHQDVNEYRWLCNVVNFTLPVGHADYNKLTLCKKGWKIYGQPNGVGNLSSKVSLLHQMVTEKAPKPEPRPVTPPALSTSVLRSHVVVKRSPAPAVPGKAKARKGNRPDRRHSQ